MRKIQRIELKQKLNSKVCEIVFIRRRPERAPGREITRRMICSNSISLLNSQDGKISLNFHFPRGPKKIDEAKHNVVVVWDIIMQDYRNVSMDYCFLVREMDDDVEFWKYYNEFLFPMNSEQKLFFMDS